MIRGAFLSKSGFVLMIIGALILLPTILLKMGLSGNWYVDTFTNPFVCFGVIVVTGSITIYPWFRPHWFSILLVMGLVTGAYLYVWGLLL